MRGMQSNEAGELFLRHVLGERQKLIAYIRSIVRQRDLAEDIFQDVCVLALQKQNEIVDASHLAGWLRVSARQLAMNAIRKHSRRDVLLGEKVNELMEAHWNQFDKINGSAMGEALDLCLGRISKSERDILNARYREGLKSNEVARRFGRPVGSLYTTLGRIHKKLAQCILQRIALAGEFR